MPKSSTDQIFWKTNVSCKYGCDVKLDTNNKTSIVKSLYLREIYLTKNQHRHTLNILRRTFSSSSSKLVLKHKFQLLPSNFLIYSYGKVFAQAPGASKVNCYSVYGCCSSDSQNLPLLYSFPVLPKIEDFITYNGPVHQMAIRGKETYRPCIFAIRTRVSASGKESLLYQYDSETGNELFSVYLSNTWKYCEVIDDSESGRLIIKSAKKQFRGHENNDNINSDILLRLILFEYLPLQLLASFPIRRSVFGRKINNVFVSQNLLLVYHDCDIIKIYSIEDIINQANPVYLLGDQITNDEGSFIVGKSPIGIPSNVSLDIPPPCLFEVKTCSYELSIGGTPWFYVYSPKPKHYKVCDLKTHSSASLILESDSKSLEPDFVGFHPLRAATIIQQSSTVFRTWDSSLLDSLKPIVRETFNFSIQSAGKEGISAGFSRYGRKLSYSCNLHDSFDDVYDLAHDFEDELDMLGILILQDCNNQRQILVEKLFLFDTNYNKFNEFEIMEFIEGSNIISHVSLTLDLDIVAIKVKSTSKSTLLVFQLGSNIGNETPTCDMNCRSKRTRYIPSNPVATRHYNALHEKHD